MTYDPQNIIAKIINGEIPSKKIYEDDYVLAIEDIEPAAPIHILVIPKIKAINYKDFVNQANSEIIAHFFLKISHIAEIAGAENYRLITNCGADAGQSIMHFHVHILSGKKLDKLLP